MIRRFISVAALAVAAVAAVVAPASAANMNLTCSVGPETIDRPVGNTGEGYFVEGAKLYAPGGIEFRPRGVNRNHWDSFGTPTGLPLSGANTERIVLNFAKPTAYNWNIIQSEMLTKSIVPIPGNWTATCKSDRASLNAIVDTWVAQASTWTQLNKTGLINVANEWGPDITVSQTVNGKVTQVPTTVWRDGNIDSILRMRAVGYTMPLVIDAGSCGQSAATVLKYGAEVLAADPQHNILFDVHVYGGWHHPATASWMQDYDVSMAALHASGLPLIIGEFGPGRNIGPNPTTITPDTVIATAELNGWGWLAWSWDDNNLQGCTSDNNGFSLTTKCGSYTGNDKTELTTFGQTIVPILKSYATLTSTEKPATVQVQVKPLR